METMKDPNVDKLIKEVISLTNQINSILLKLRDEDVTVRFKTAGYPIKPGEKLIEVSEAQQRVNYFEVPETKTALFK